MAQFFLPLQHVKTIGMQTNCHFHSPFKTSSKCSRQSSVENWKTCTVVTVTVVTVLTWHADKARWPNQKPRKEYKKPATKHSPFTNDSSSDTDSEDKCIFRPQGNSTKFYNVQLHVQCNIAYFVLFITLVRASLIDYWRRYFLLFEASHWGNSNDFFLSVF